ncbi:MAG: hypothetical protein QOK40_362 [Miltoncostaeaceae bacterium]|jgi:TnpA family transposase|nr:hypothetical protein [Miltoncostaeaceae bacterium]
MSGTGGYSDLVFGLFRLLGYQFSPRLADAGGARFWRLDRGADDGPLNQVGRHQVDTGLMREGWDDLLRAAASLAGGVTRANNLVRALRGRGPQTAALAQAIAEVGRVAKTVHLLDYCTDESFRRRIQGQLNRAETRHSLARAVFHGRRGELHRPYRDGQEDQISALGLVVNCIALWNTIYTGRVLEHLRAGGHPVHDEDAERLSPLGHDHINLVGRYRLTLAERVRRGGDRELSTSGQIAS